MSTTAELTNTGSTTARRWSIPVLALSWGLAACAIGLVPLTSPTWHVGQWYGLVDTADAIVFGAVASLLLARGRHPVSWLVATCAIGGGLAAVGFQWTMCTLAHPGAPTLPALQSMQNVAWVPGTYSMIILVPVLVRRHPLRTADRLFVALGSATIAVLTMMRLTDPYPWPDGDTMAPLAIRSEWWLDTVERTVEWQFRVVVVLAAVAIADLTRRWWNQSPADRRGLGWLAVGATLMTAAFLPLAVPASWVTGLPAWFTPVLHLTSQLFFPAALLVAVLGQRIAGLEVMVSRATLWALLTGLLVAVYVVIVTIGGAMLPDATGVVVALATASVAVLFTPLRRFVQRRIDALVHGEGTVPARALAGVGRRLGTAADDSELLEGIAESVRHALRLGGLAIEVDWPSGARRLASVGELTAGSAEERPLVVQREVVGRLVVSGRPGELLDRSTTEALDDLAPVVAAVVQLVARTKELTESRARIVETRDQERRRLRRELHDGFGPMLAGVALGLRASTNALPTDPTGAGRLVEQMADEVDGLVEDVRSLARGLMPPVLDDLGLVPALEDLVERHRLSGDLDILLEVEQVAVDPLVGQEVYGIVVEAVRNVVRHAGATTCTVSLGYTNRQITVVVVDDGVGLPDRPVNGVGLVSMRERAEALGATLDVMRLDRGTRVELCVPTGSEALSVGGGDDH